MYHFSLVHLLVLGAPCFGKLEAIRQCLENASCYSVEILFREFFVFTRIFALLELFVSEMEEHFEIQFEKFRLFLNRESDLKIRLCESCNFGTRVKERTVPKREDLLDVGTKLSLCLSYEA